MSDQPSTAEVVSERSEDGLEEPALLSAADLVRGPTREQIRSRRKREVRAVTVSVKRLPKHALEEGRLAYPEEALPLPSSRLDCVGTSRPCPLVRCAHHLYLDISPRTGAIKLNFPDCEVEDLPESCSLDLADRGGMTLEESAERLNMTRERLRQIENIAIDKLRARPKDIAVLLEYASDPRTESLSPLAQARRDNGEGNGGGGGGGGRDGGGGWGGGAGPGGGIEAEEPGEGDEPLVPRRLFADGRPEALDTQWVWRVASSRDEERRAKERGERFDLGGVPLSPPTAQIVEFVRGMWTGEGRGPSKDEVAAHLGLEGSTAGRRVRVDSLLLGLRQAGWVTVSRKHGITIARPLESESKKPAPATAPAPTSPVPPPPPAPPPPDVTTRERRAQVASTRAKKRRERTKARVAPAPHYDEVYAEGVWWLDSRTGDPPVQIDAASARQPTRPSLAEDLLAPLGETVARALYRGLVSGVRRSF